MSRRREPQFDGSVANDRNEIAPPHRSSLRSRRHSNTSPNGSVLCVTAKLPGHVRVGSCVTSTAGPHGGAQLYVPDHTTIADFHDQLRHSRATEDAPGCKKIGNIFLVMAGRVPIASTPASPLPGLKGIGAHLDRCREPGRGSCREFRAAEGLHRPRWYSPRQQRGRWQAATRYVRC
jgi:hypothetical protein